MKRTTNYSQFKMLNENRQLNRQHINKLKQSISEHGYLESNPILVNEDYEIIDGQHRFTALKEMGLPVPYQTVEAKKNLLIDLNITQKRWNMNDYINYYKEKDKNENYRRISRLQKELNIDATTLMIIAYGRYTDGSDTRAVREGRLKFTLDNELCVRCFYGKYDEIIKKLNLLPRTKLCAAFVEISAIRNFDWDVMLQKAVKYPTLAYNCRTKQEYIEMLKNLYNHNQRKEENRI